MSYTPPYQDNTILYNATISSTGPITGIDTTGANSIVAQFSGEWVGTLVFEGSHDNTNWFTLLSVDLDTLQVNETITSIGFIGLKVSSKFIRVNTLSLVSGTIPTIILGKTSIGISAADVIALAMDKSNNSPLYIEETATNKDVNKSFIPSDAPKPIYNTLIGLNSVSTPIDTIGYQSLVFQTFGTWNAIITLQASNDGVNWLALQFSTISASQLPASTLAFNSIFIAPTSARYIRFTLTAYTSGTVQIISYLRQQPSPPTSSITNANIADLGGNGVQLAGISGVQAVGGFNAVGTSPNASPMVAGGIDTAGLVRRVLTDTSGRIATNINTAATDALGIARALNVLPPASNPYNLSALLTQDVGTFEGMSMIELLGAIWKEMKLANWYSSQASEQDEPNAFRNDFENSLAN